MQLRPAWARRLFKRLDAKHDLKHFDGAAWKVVNLGMGSWMFVRRATNGDYIEFHPYDESGNPFAKYYRKATTDAPEETPES